MGFLTVEYLAGARADMIAHLAGERPIDVAAFERETLGPLGMPSLNEAGAQPAA